MPKPIKIIKTSTYKKSLKKLKDPEVILRIENKIDKLLDNPDLAIPMKKQHMGICEVQVGKKYRVYCIKEENIIIIIILGKALHHKQTFKQGREYKKIFLELKQLRDSYKEVFNQIESLS